MTAGSPAPETPDPVDVDAIRAEWLNQCGACDGGLPMQCTCSTRDHRPTMLALVEEVERLRAAESRPESDVRAEAGCESCFDCLSKMPGDFGLPATAFRVVTCPDCGNKRCPKSTHHDNPCTGSNEPGQPGSRYLRIARGVGQGGGE